MLRWSLIFFIVAVFAGIFGFTGVAAGAMQIAQVLFTIFIFLFLITLLIAMLLRPKTNS